MSLSRSTLTRAATAITLVVAVAIMYSCRTPAPSLTTGSATLVPADRRAPRPWRAEYAFVEIDYFPRAAGQHLIPDLEGLLE